MGLKALLISQQMRGVVSAGFYNMAKLSQIDIPYPEADAKNLFVRVDKKRNYYLMLLFWKTDTESCFLLKRCV